jgi:hypothetical protein
VIAADLPLMSWQASRSHFESGHLLVIVFWSKMPKLRSGHQAQGEIRKQGTQGQLVLAWLPTAEGGCGRLTAEARLVRTNLISNELQRWSDAPHQIRLAGDTT